MVGATDAVVRAGGEMEEGEEEAVAVVAVGLAEGEWDVTAAAAPTTAEEEEEEVTPPRLPLRNSPQLPSKNAKRKRRRGSGRSERKRSE